MSSKEPEIMLLVSVQLHLQCTQDFVSMLVITESRICYPHSNNTMNKNTHMWGPAFDPLYHKLTCTGNKVERWSVFEVKIVEKFNWHICFWEFRSFEGMEKKCRINLFIEQRTAKHHNKHRAKTLKIQDISVGRDVKTFSEEKCPRGRQMPKQLWQRKKGGKYEWTEGTTIIYVNNVPLLLIISGKIKQKRKKKRGGGGVKHHACHPTNFSHAN